MKELTEKEIVRVFLKKRSQRVLKLIKFGGELNFRIFVLTVALIAILPLIQKSEDFQIKTVFSFMSFNYNVLVTFFFMILLGLLCFNIYLGLVNIIRKREYIKLISEIRSLS